MKYIKSTILAVLTCLALTAPAQQVELWRPTSDRGLQGGLYRDGAKMQWQCHPKASGYIEFAFTTVDGKMYHGTMECGVPV